MTFIIDPYRHAGGLGTYEEEVQADNPFIFFDFATTSGAAQDVSGEGNHSVGDTNMSKSNTGLYTGSTNSWKFNGTNSQIDTGVAHASLSGSVTVECWVRIPGTIPSGSIWEFGGSAVGTQLWIRNGSRFIGSFADTPDRAFLAFPSTNTTYHIACVFDSGSSVMSWYFNGAHQATRTGLAGGFAGSNDGALGAVNGGASASENDGSGDSESAAPSNVRVDGFAVYDYALSAARIADHYDAGIA